MFIHFGSPFTLSSRPIPPARLCSIVRKRNEWLLSKDKFVFGLFNEVATHS